MTSDPAIEARATPDPAFEERVLTETRRFVEQVVIDLGLCPFAEQPWTQGRVDVRVSTAREPAALLIDLDTEMRRLIEAPLDELETTLLVHPHVLGEFAPYNDFLDLTEALLRERGHEGVLQLASFHPAYRFEGAPAGDPADATNRSPWPMLHLLREASVAAAVASHPDPGGIPDRNVARLREMGADTVNALLDSLRERDDTPV